MKKMKSVDTAVMMVLIDAFSFNYLSQEYTPYLYSLANEGVYSTIRPMFAYRGIEATIFTGASPNTHKVWTEFCLRDNIEENLASLMAKECCKFTDKIPIEFLHKATRYLYYLSDKRLRPAMIPANMLGYFESSQPSITEPSVLPVPTLFDILRKEGKRFVFLTPHKGNDQMVFKTAYKFLENRREEFWFIKFGLIDPIGHKYGPNPEAIGQYLKDVDYLVHKLHLRFKEKFKSGIFLVLSDHGMNQVHMTVDIKKKLNNLNLTIPKDYIYFIDSTMARFWFFNEKAKKSILDNLSDINEGSVLQNLDLKILEIDRIGHRYGETIFALKNGYVFFPDFFRWSYPPKGMHGYAYEIDKPVLIVSTNEIDVKNKIKTKFIDIMPTVLEVLNLDIPPSCEGKSIIKG